MLRLAPDRHERRRWCCRGHHPIRTAGARRMRLIMWHVGASGSSADLSAAAWRPVSSCSLFFSAASVAMGARFAHGVANIAVPTLGLFLLLLSAGSQSHAEYI